MILIFCARKKKNNLKFVCIIDLIIDLIKFFSIFFSKKIVSEKIKSILN